MKRERRAGLRGKRAIKVGLCALAISLIIGCGGGDSTGSTVSASAPGKAAYIKHMDAICLKYHNQFQSEFSEYLRKHPPIDAAHGAAGSLPFLARIGLPIAKAEAKAARALEAPEGAAGEVESMLTTFEKWIKEFETTIRTSNTSEFGRRYPEHYKAHRLAMEFGLSGKCLVL